LHPSEELHLTAGVRCRQSGGNGTSYGYPPLP
jgi:hypothetical protein